MSRKLIPHPRHYRLPFLQRWEKQRFRAALFGITNRQGIYLCPPTELGPPFAPAKRAKSVFFPFPLFPCGIDKPDSCVWRLCKALMNKFKRRGKEEKGKRRVQARKVGMRGFSVPTSFPFCQGECLRLRRASFLFSFP